MVAKGEATKASVHVADVTNAKTLDDVAAAVGEWHILVLASGYCPSPGPVASSEAEEWWKGFEVWARLSFFPSSSASPPLPGPGYWVLASWALGCSLTSKKKENYNGCFVLKPNQILARSTSREPSSLQRRSFLPLVLRPAPSSWV